MDTDAASRVGEPERLKGIGALAVVVSVLLACYVPLELVSLGGAVVQLIGYGGLGGARDQSLADVGVLLRGLSGLGQLAVYVPIIVTFCVWTYRVAVNARALGGRGFADSPGMAVGWYFVPFAHLWMPYRALREVWLASDPLWDSASPEDWPMGRVGALLPGWWAAWIFGTIAGNFGSMMARKGPPFEMIGAWLNPVGSLLQVLAAVLCVAVVLGLTGRQRRRARHLSGNPRLRL